LILLHTIKSLKQQKQLKEGITKYLSILTLDVKMSMDSTTPLKDTIWQTRLKSKIYQSVFLQETHLIDRNKYWLKVKGWKKIYQASGP
jgi:hypothetical protein